nr:myosin-11-like isoform X1 [Tanacetum cinerariifolium]
DGEPNYPQRRCHVACLRREQYPVKSGLAATLGSRTTHLSLQFNKTQESNLELVYVLHELEETMEKQRLGIESFKPLQDKINELERDCNELTHENLDLVSKLKESSKNLSVCVDVNEDYELHSVRPVEAANVASEVRFFLIDRMVILDAMAWRHHDLDISDRLPAVYQKDKDISLSPSYSGLKVAVYRNRTSDDLVSKERFGSFSLLSGLLAFSLWRFTSIFLVACAGSDTRPPMLDRTDFESWQQHIHLYCMGKDNGVNILNSIDECPFKMAKFKETLVEGALHLGPERDRALLILHQKKRRGGQANTFDDDVDKAPIQDLSLNEDNVFQADQCDTFESDNKVVNESLTAELARYNEQVKLYEKRAKFELTEREQKIDEQMRIIIQDCNVQEELLKKELRSVKMQLNSTINHNKLIKEEVTMLKKGAALAGNEGVQKRVSNANPGQAKPIKCGQANTFDDDVDKAPIQDLALNEDNVFQANQCDTFESDVDEAPTAHTMFMVNLSSADPIFDEAGPSYDSDILSEIQDHDNYIDSIGEYHEVHEMQNDVQPNYIVDSNDEYTSDSFRMSSM